LGAPRLRVICFVLIRCARATQALRTKQHQFYNYLFIHTINRVAVCIPWVYSPFHERKKNHETKG
jgi:hypothetical protein